MHDFKPGDLVRTRWTREPGIVVQQSARNESWKQIFVRVHWFDRATVTQARHTSIRHLEEE